MKVSASVTAVLATFAMLAGAAQPQQAGPLRIVVHRAAGDGAEAIGATIASALREGRTTEVAVEIREDGAAKVAVSAPDGLTLLIASVPTLASDAIGATRNGSYDLKKDLVAVALIGAVPWVLLVSPEMQVKSLSELVTKAKEQPGSLTYASTSEVTGAHLVTEIFLQTVGLDLKRVGYRNTRQAIADVESAKVSMMFTLPFDAMNHIRTARVRPLVVTTGRRVALLPDAPGAIEAGLPGFEADSAIMLLAPAATPPEVIARINGTVQALLKRGDFRERLLRQGAYAIMSTPQSAQKRLDDDLSKWANVIDRARKPSAD